MEVLQQQVEELLKQDKKNRKLLDQLIQKYDKLKEEQKRESGRLWNTYWNHVNFITCSLLININILCIFCCINSIVLIHTQPTFILV